MDTPRKVSAADQAAIDIGRDLKYVNKQAYYPSTEMALEVAVDMLDAIAKGETYDAITYHERLRALKETIKQTSDGKVL